MALWSIAMATRRTTRKSAGKQTRAPSKAAPKSSRRRATPRKAARKVAIRTVAARKHTAATRTTKPAQSEPPRVRKTGPAVVNFRERLPPTPLAEARPLRIVIFGASGNLGRRITKEALSRGHQVTAVMRNPQRLDVEHPNLRPLRADVTDPLLVSTVARGHDVIISAIAPARDSPESLAQAAKSLLQGAREAGIKRVMVVNGAGSLKVGKGKILMDTPQFPKEWRWLGQAHKDALDVLREEGTGLDWTAVSPAARIEPGKRTGKFRLGGDTLVADAKGESRISMEDYAAAFMDELEGEHYVGRRMTVAY